MDDLYRRMVNELPSMVWAARTRPEAHGLEWLYIGERMLAWLGASREQALGNPHLLGERIHSDDRASFEAAWAHASKTCTPLDWTGRAETRAGETRWAHIEARPQREPEGSVVWYGETRDRTEQQRAREALERARSRDEKMLRAVIDALPVLIGVMDTEGRWILANETAIRTLNQTPVDGVDNIVEAYGIYSADGSRRLTNDVMPVVRALRGEAVDDAEFLHRSAATPQGVLVRYSSRPLRDEDGKVWAGFVYGTDVTATRALERDVERRTAELVASEEAKTTLIERLRYAIDELSTPVLEVWDDVLVTPVIGVIDSRRMADMVQKLLAEIVRTQAQYVIVDLTGVDLVDTKTADHLIKMVRKAELIGARCMLTGIQPSVAQTLVDIGVDFGRLTTLRNLKHGLQRSMQRRVVSDGRAAPTETATAVELGER